MLTMNRLRNCVVILSCLMATSAMAWSFLGHKKKPHPQHVPAAHHEPYRMILPAFRGVIADGNIRVHLNGDSKQAVYMSTKSKDLFSDIKWKVRKGTLYIRDMRSRKVKRKTGDLAVLNVRIRFPLERLETYDNASVTGTNIRSRHLRIISDSTGAIRLTGMMEVDNILQTGPGSINLRWIESGHLKVVSGGHGTIRLAGSVDTFNAKAWNQSVVDARYLRSQYVLAQTGERAEIDVTPIESLSAFASDRGKVYFFKSPEYLTRHSYASGQILQMRHWN